MTQTEAYSLDKPENLLLYNLHFCLRSLITYIQQAQPPLMKIGPTRFKTMPVIESHDFKLSLKTLEEAKLALENIKTKLGAELVDACSKPNKI